MDFSLDTFLNSALVIGAITFVIRSMFLHFLNKDIALYKEQIKSEASNQLESFKSELEKDRLRLQISYGGMFEKQANAVIDIYRALLDLDVEVHKAIHEPEEPLKRRDNFRQHWLQVRTLYSQSRVLLPPEVDAQLNGFFDELFSNVLKYNMADYRITRGISDEEYDKLSEKQNEVLSFIGNGVPALTELLVESMRKTLGVNS